MSSIAAAHVFKRPMPLVLLTPTEKVRQTDVWTFRAEKLHLARASSTSAHHDRGTEAQTMLDFAWMPTPDLQRPDG